MSTNPENTNHPDNTENQDAQTNRRTKFKATQLGNAERLVYHHGNSIRWCPAWKSWLVWNGRQWSIDHDGAVERKAHRTVRLMAAEASRIKDREIKRRMQVHAQHSETKYELDAMIAIAKTLEGVTIAPKALDANPLLLNCTNGVLDLKSGTLHSHNDYRDAHLTKIAPVAYRPGARCPVWLGFLDRIFNQDAGLIEYVQKVVGYALTGLVTEKALFVFHGEGNNGKTTLLETIRRMLGDYARTIEIDALMQGSQDSARERAMAMLQGKRFVTASEAEAGTRFRESTIKQLTGMGRLIGRRLYADPFEFDPEFKLFIDANHKPVIRGTDEAIWLRMRLIPFLVTIPPEEIDKNLWKKLYAELPGILTWAVKGCLLWQKDGLALPNAVKEASNAYRGEMDIVSLFVADCCERDGYSREGATKLYQAFDRWCGANEVKPMGQNAFGARLGRLGFGQHRTKDGIRWIGLRLLDEPAPPSEAKPPTTFRNLDLRNIDLTSDQRM